MAGIETDLPSPTPATKRFWDATAEGRIELARCDDCGLTPWFPRAKCPHCESTSRTWLNMSGRGTVYSCATARAEMLGSTSARLQDTIAYVQLDEGPIILTAVDCDPLQLQIGMKVEASFEDTGDGVALVRFVPATS